MNTRIRFHPGEEALGEVDRAFLSSLDGELAGAVRRASRHVTCRLGCTECCMGPFDITLLDAWRLRRGLGRLARRDAGRAAALVARARAQWAVIRGGFPGNPGTGELTGDDVAREAFFAAHDEMPCPALDRATGACELYESRPVSCRTFGVPIRCGDQSLPPCRLNFVGASGQEIVAAALDPDPDDVEGDLLGRLGGRATDTVIPWVLSGQWRDVGSPLTGRDVQPVAWPRRRRR